jgi:hypothetical protein
MYYDAVKAAFNLFPLDPPSKLNLGDYVRIGLSGKVLHFGNLGSLLGVEIEYDKISHNVEYLSHAVTKASTSAEATGLAKAKIAFSNEPGLYLRGKRTVFKMRNIELVLAKLAKAHVDWSLRYRIVVETHVVEKADIVCSNSSSADIRVGYNDQGLPVAVDADYAKQVSGLLHLPDVSGTIAFGAIRFSRLLGTLHATSARSFEYRALDVNDSKSFEDNLEDA